jgi:hypothetical protein
MREESTTHARIWHSSDPNPVFRDPRWGRIAQHRPVLNSALPGLYYLLAASGLFAASLAGYFIGQRHLTTERHHPPLQVAPESLNLGRVDATADFPWTLKIKNVSRRTVRVADIKTSCGCTRIRPTGFEIASGQTQDVEFHINLAVTKRQGAIGLESPVAIRIVPIIEGANLPPPVLDAQGDRRRALSAGDRSGCLRRGRRAGGRQAGPDQGNSRPAQQSAPLRQPTPQS